MATIFLNGKQLGAIIAPVIANELSKLHNLPVALDNEFEEVPEVRVALQASVLKDEMTTHMQEALNMQAVLESGDVWFDEASQMVMVDITTGTTRCRQSVGGHFAKILGVPLKFC